MHFPFYRTHLTGVVIALLCSGCFTVTRYSDLQNLGERLSASDKVIFYYVNDPLCEECFDVVKRVFDKNAVPVIFFPHEEYTLKAAGISNVFDTSYHTLLRKNGFTHFLLVELAGSKNKRSFMESYTPFEVAQSNLHGISNAPTSTVIPDNDAQAVVTFQLYSLERKTTSYRLTVKTTQNAVVHQRDDGGETHYNLGSNSMAVSTALKKGARKIFEN